MRGVAGGSSLLECDPGDVAGVAQKRQRMCISVMSIVESIYMGSLNKPGSPLALLRVGFDHKLIYP